MKEEELCELALALSLILSSYTTVVGGGCTFQSFFLYSTSVYTLGLSCFAPYS